MQTIQQEQEPRKGIPIRILTHNIRYAADSSQRFPNEKPWSERLPGLIAELKYHTRQYPGSFICLQEVLHGQLLDILDSLNQAPSPHSADGEEVNSEDEEDDGEWTYYGVGRDDGLIAGEYSPIFYRQPKNRYEKGRGRGVYWRKVHAETKWLSPTPDVRGSKGWDAASVRIVTMVVFEMGRKEEGEGDSNDHNTYINQEREWIIIPKFGQPQTIPSSSFSPSSSSEPETRNQASSPPPPYSQYSKRETHANPNRKPRRKRLLLLNTHLDNQGRISRIESAKLILRFISQLRKRWDVDAVVLAGDLNSEAPSAHSDRSITSSALSSSFYSSSTTTSGASNHHDLGTNLEQDTKDDIDAYKILNTPPSPLHDLRTLIPPKQRYGYDMTYTGFDGSGDDEGRCTRIDFIHINTTHNTTHNTTKFDYEDRGGEKEISTPWKVQGYAVLPNIFDDGGYMSDHRAVVGDLVLQ